MQCATRRSQIEHPERDDVISLGTAGATPSSEYQPSATGSLSMLDKLDFMVRFWKLRERHEALETPLLPSERVELLSLLQLMATDQHLPAAGPLVFSEGGIPVQLTVGGGFLAGELRFVCPEGLVITCRAPMV